MWSSFTLCPESAALLLFLVAIAPTISSAGPVTSPGPVVNLGYQRHLGNLDPTSSYYNFSNVRFAAPPTGQNRFRAPQNPAEDLSSIHNGMEGRVCAQANPGWFTIVNQWIGTYTPGSHVNITEQQVSQLAAFPLGDLPLLDPGDGRITEDCLFLDVLVPKSSMPSNQTKQSVTPVTAPITSTGSSGLPVIVWLSGGGYTSGDKTGYSTGTSPAGLIKASEADGGDGAIFVAINYRLGAFGWLAGSEIASDGNANAGLLDQRFAFEWVQKYIHLFGGDPRRITVMGESAGAGSLMHHITSYGGSGSSLPFQQAILQSPAFNPTSSRQNIDRTYNDLLQYAGVSDLVSLRNVSFETLAQANALQVARSNYSSYTYTPTIDGSYVPGPPGALLAAGKFNKDIKLLLANNAYEGLLFSNPTVQTKEAFDQLVVELAPTFSSQEIDTITTQLYPPEFNGMFGYVDEITRQATILADLIVACNNVYLSNAFDNRTYAYLFAVPQAFHGQDVPYTYYNGVDQVQGNIGPQTIDVNVAHALQEILTTFAATGQPTYGKGMTVAEWGSTANILTLNTTGFIEEPDSAASSRCQFWQSVQTQLNPI